MGGWNELAEEVLEDGPFEGPRPPPMPGLGLDEAAAAAPAEPTEPPGFAKLRSLLDDPRPFADDHHRRKAGRFVRKALHSIEFEKAVLDPQTSPVWRLKRLSDLQRMASTSDLRAVDRQEALTELDRGGMRILWSIGLVDRVINSGAPPENRAAALLWLISEKILPTGACARSALEPAKQLLMSPEASEALKKSPQMRDQILDLLAAAEARRAAAAKAA
jgi:hypothetical protein